MKISTLKLSLLTGLVSIAGAFGLQAADFTWDPLTTTTGSDGPGTWDITSSLWANSGIDQAWDNVTPANAIFGVNSGTAGQVTISAGLTINVGNLTFNTPGGGNYSVAPGDLNSRLSFSPSSVVTVASGLIITNTVVQTGTSSFTKVGPGTFWVRPASANLNSGVTVVTGGTLVMGSSGSRVVIPGDLVVTNTGDARLGAANTIASTATVSVAPGATFEMNGNALALNGFVMNGGTVTQTGSEALAVYNFDARSGSISQSGIGTGKLDGNLTKSTSGTFTTTGRGSSAATGGLTNTVVNQGTLVLDYTQNSSKLNDSGTLTVNGGTLVFTNGTHTEAVGAVTLTGGSITNSGGTAKLSVATGSYDVRAGSVYTVLTGAAGLTKTTSATVVLATAMTYTGGTTISAGVLQLGDGTTSGTLSTTGGGAITDNSVLMLSPGPAGASVANPISGSGAVVMSGNGTATFTGANNYQGSTTISNGVLSLNSSSTLGDGTGNLVLSGGTLSSTASRTPSSAPVTNPVIVTDNSAITTSSASSIVDFNLSNNSIGGSTGSLTFSNAAASGTGVFEPRFSGSGFNFSQPVVIANGGFGTTRLDSYNTTGTTQTFSGAISGTGGYRRTASISGSGGNTVLAGNNTYTGNTDVNQGVLMVNGSLGSSIVAVAANGTLGGYGTINGPVTVTGTLLTGPSIGILTISNSLTFASGGTCFMELNKSTPANDLLTGVTTVTYGGTLTVTNLSGTLAANDTFKLFSATTYAGSFSATNLPTLSGGLVWDASGLTSNGSIKVVSTGGSPVLGFTQSGNTLTFSWTGAYKLQSQTNSLSVGINTNWADYPDTSNPTAVTIDPTSPSVFFRLTQ
jgi:fibronectin-binding autotransporter adhesin